MVEIKIMPAVQQVEINQRINLKVEGIYSGKGIKISFVNWQSNKKGIWMYASNGKGNEVIYIPRELGVHQIRAEWGKLKDYISFEVKGKSDATKL